MHGSQHARDVIALLDQRHQRRYSALVITTTSSMREDKLLELLDLVL